MTIPTSSCQLAACKLSKMLTCCRVPTIPRSQHPQNFASFHTQQEYHTSVPTQSTALPDSESAMPQHLVELLTTAHLLHFAKIPLRLPFVCRCWTSAVSLNLRQCTQCCTVRFLYTFYPLSLHIVGLWPRQLLKTSGCGSSWCSQYCTCCWPCSHAEPWR